MLTYGNHFWSATASAFHLGVLPDDRWLSILPLYHVGGLAVLFRCCLYGAAAVLQEGFDLDAVNRSLDEEAITLVSLVPTMLYRLLPTRASWPERLRLVLLGGAAASPELVAQALAAGVPVATTYGLTEAASQVATMLPDEARDKPGSVGRPLLFTEMQILGDGNAPLPAGEIGEVAVRGPAVMAGYYAAPKATAEALRGGWLHTGDMGYLDEDGDLWLVQRRSDIIVSGGENVYPAEVEAVLGAHPAVAAAAVVGLPDAEWGEQVAALVVVREGRTIEAGELLRFARQRLAGYKLPRRLSFVDAMPQTALGKVARAAVREMLLVGRDATE
jgi:O-succinylbenzoic acid--CoA ligase